MRAFFFFFQAEDGIRDLTVTGVQTCALPISRGSPDEGDDEHIYGPLISRTERNLRLRYVFRDEMQTLLTDARSEERRVGKECRVRLAQGLLEKNNNDGDISNSSLHRSWDKVQ